MWKNYFIEKINDKKRCRWIIIGQELPKKNDLSLLNEGMLGFFNKFVCLMTLISIIRK